MLHRDEKLLSFFINSDAEGAMRSLELARSRNVSFLFTGEHGQPILGVAVDVIDVARHRIHINTAVHRDLGSRPTDDSFRLGQRCFRRRIVLPSIHHDLCEVLVLKDDFVMSDVYRYSAERRVRILNYSDRSTRYLDCLSWIGGCRGPSCRGSHLLLPL